MEIICSFRHLSNELFIVIIKLILDHIKMAYCGRELWLFLERFKL